MPIGFILLLLTSSEGQLHLYEQTGWVANALLVIKRLRRITTRITCLLVFGLRFSNVAQIHPYLYIYYGKFIISQIHPYLYIYYGKFIVSYVWKLNPYML